VTSQLPAAVLWDMDGTLVDTEPYWFAAESELVSSFGGTWTLEDGMQLVGNGLWHSATVLRRSGVDLPEGEIIDRLTERVLAQAKAAVPWRAGALELVLALREAGVPTALVTMSMRALAEHIAQAVGRPLFDVIVTGEDVLEPKPHPEPYLLAARLLDVDAKDCVAIEDSVPGLASATAAGAAVIGVPAHIDLPASTSYTLWPTLAGRTVDDVVALLASPGSRTPAAGSAGVPS
jgi:HAD superfamily hydrolase (TIGR01509 family)